MSGFNVIVCCAWTVCVLSCNGQERSGTTSTTSSAPFHDESPILIHQVDPEYPEEARAAGVTGDVVLEILVGTDGSTPYLRTLSPLEHGCTEAAIDAVEQFRWKPASNKNEPVEAKGIVRVGFPPNEGYR